MPRTLVAVLLAAACSFHPSQESGIDSAGIVFVDASIDSAVDTAPIDSPAATIDAAIDAMADAAVDAPIDSPPDAPRCSEGATQCAGPELQTCTSGAWVTSPCDFTCATVSGSATCVAVSNTSAVANVCTTAPSTWPALDPGPGGTITYSAPGGNPELACTTGSGSNCGAVAQSVFDTSTIPGVSWFCLKSLALASDAKLVVDYANAPSGSLGIIVDGSAAIAGAISVDGSAAAPYSNPSAITKGDCSGPAPLTTPGPGGFPGACQDDAAGTNAVGSGAGQGGGQASTGVGTAYVGGGGGGGSYATAGAAGGHGQNLLGYTANGGLAGATFLLVNQLVGGGGGGGGGDADGGVGDGWAGGGGGGAIQISARGSISLTGAITAKGGNGYGVTNASDGGGGGGAGGEILLEAPLVSLAGSLIVDGGHGGVAGASGGAGATGSAAAQAGGSYNTSDASSRGGGGGGGGGGRIFVNTAAGSACSGTFSPASSCTGQALVGSAY